MSKFNNLLIARFKNHPKKEKVSELAHRSSTRSLTDISSPFRVRSMTDQEKGSLRSLLEKYQKEGNDISQDLTCLTTITSEVKAISNQAVLLHGERIKRAQQLFKKYRDGAFSHWLLKTYGNRQTPYNFMQYYELYTILPKNLQNIVDEMPRQAIYSLSSRTASQEKKVAFLEGYHGESKTQLLEKLRIDFPLPTKDKRKGNRAKTFFDLLNRATQLLRKGYVILNHKEKIELQAFIKEMKKLTKS